jgi:hypothetical protein
MSPTIRLAPRCGVAAGWLHDPGDQVAPSPWRNRRNLDPCEAGIGTPVRRRVLGIRGLARDHDPIDRAESAAPGRVHRWTRLRMASRRISPPTSIAAVRVRPNVDRDCRSFRSCCLPRNAHCRSGAWLAFVLQLTAASRPAPGRVHRWVRFADGLAPNFAAQQPRSGESATQRGSRLPIISLMLPAGQRALLVGGLARVRAPIDRAESAVSA